MSTSDSSPFILAITACPTGIAHTYMAAENLEAAAEKLGYRIKIETHGSIGVEGNFSAQDIEQADAIVIGADTVITKDRFHGKRLVATGVDEAIKHPEQLLTKSLEAAEWKGEDKGTSASEAEDTAEDAGLRGIGQTMYKALMNGVSHMIPFVVTGGLLIAVALSLGGTPTPEGLSIPEDSFWNTLNELGGLAFSLMVPVLSGYIAVGIADRPGLAPGLITGLIATTGSLYGSEAGAGFLGGIVTGILSGYVALAIKKIPVHKFIAPIWPIIVIPIFTTLIVGLAFIYFIGAPIATAFEAMTEYLGGLQGSSAIVLGLIIGAMIAFDMGGPFNKTAFLFGGGMIAAGNAAPMGMAAAAIAVPPLAVGVATLLRRGWFNKAEKDSGIAALFMGFFGITEGAIPLAAARPLQVIPANVVGGAVAGAMAGAFGVRDHVMHGGPIVAVLGAVDQVAWFFLSMLCGVAVCAALMLLLIRLTQRSPETEENTEEPTVLPLLGTSTISLDEPLGNDSEAVIKSLVSLAAADGRISDAAAVADAALARESQHSTGVGHGVAIPHARSAGVTTPTLAFARLPEGGITWGTGEGPTSLAFLIAVPDDAGKQHLKLLSTLARAIMKEDFRAQLHAANSREEAEEVIASALQIEPQAAVES
ncbi:MULTISPECIES: fructose-specific PTS transporter subunit EIIC [Corynebacterium]|uniref:fructose-specific PTS transporter subunit EIIC n=1 Tax=Corynebacterium TaxID=1716 RepID=UPI00254DD3A3|nr:MULTISPECIES: fructose-specific PTS transporter subunit EIIC [unclassified Corynebacterium]MDK8451845.1 fructose-specific PTS transporter subunit EIIC [Corynebacterium sp. MSK084]MDK8490779.1 fructose-specific PTS transporter subunit EIIC [Corynebacterium sp. MSK175]MDK8513781.1 fructose-specific PTS transporter subunit EIIC [Corynebacterium sp. MSK123]MDK8546843.1 fructose-specific PTS transporter subunit EIIC [Corynebacterium sp. MSK222]MDK8647065.1 fructose-specific PTS transporter subun